jgi:hypothetical protein
MGYSVVTVKLYIMRDSEHNRGIYKHRNPTHPLSPLVWPTHPTPLTLAYAFPSPTPCQYPTSYFHSLPFPHTPLILKHSLPSLPSSLPFTSINFLRPRPHATPTLATLPSLTPHHVSPRILSPIMTACDVSACVFFGWRVSCV